MPPGIPGAKPSPRHRLLGAHPFIPIGDPPPGVAWLPQTLDMWGNDQYGDCVSASEAFAKATYQPEIFIDAATVKAWARKHGVLNGATLTEVLDAMQKDGFVIGSQQYNDGPYLAVDYSNETILQSAIAKGPVKIAIASRSLPSGAGNDMGWYMIGDRSSSRTDHCVELPGFGPAEWLYQQLSAVYGNIPLPPPLIGRKGYLLYTWKTIGFVDHEWLMGTCAEAWIRTPTTIGNPPLPSPNPRILDPDQWM